jgi:hypothetical protein
MIGVGDEGGRALAEFLSFLRAASEALGGGFTPLSIDLSSGRLWATACWKSSLMGVFLTTAREVGENLIEREGFLFHAPSGASIVTTSLWPNPTIPHPMTRRPQPASRT